MRRRTGLAIFISHPLGDDMDMGYAIGQAAYTVGEGKRNLLDCF